MKKVLITGGAGFIGSNLADFLLSRGESVTIYDNLSREKARDNIKWLKENRGNGKQVRDILYIDDLISAYMLAINKIDKSIGNVYNIGGGIKNKVSLTGFINILETKFNKQARVTFCEPRLGDQKVFISDNRKIRKELGWKATVGIHEGIDKLYEWIL